jgi:hypothetical protein
MRMRTQQPRLKLLRTHAKPINHPSALRGGAMPTYGLPIDLSGDPRKPPAAEFVVSDPMLVSVHAFGSAFIKADNGFTRVRLLLNGRVASEGQNVCVLPWTGNLGVGVGCCFEAAPAGRYQLNLNVENHIGDFFRDTASLRAYQVSNSTLFAKASGRPTASVILAIPTTQEVHLLARYECWISGRGRGNRQYCTIELNGVELAKSSTRRHHGHARAFTTVAAGTTATFVARQDTDQGYIGRGIVLYAGSRQRIDELEQLCERGEPDHGWW